MDVIVSPEEAEVQECDVLVAGIFKDERPLRDRAVGSIGGSMACYLGF